MPDSFRPDAPPDAFAEDARLHQEFSDAIQEEQRLGREIDDLLAGPGTREEKERRIVEEYGPKMAQAQQRSREALNRWLSALRRIE